MLLCITGDLEMTLDDETECLVSHSNGFAWSEHLAQRQHGIVLSVWGWLDYTVLCTI